VKKIEIQPGAFLFSAYYTRAEQQALLGEVLKLEKEAPFYWPVMPKSGKPFSVEETNFGSLGWISAKDGYRYDAVHPATQKPWPAIPDALLSLWKDVAGYAAAPECCLVNLYRTGARMGLHRDSDEGDFDAPVVSVSLGDDALFRIGGTQRRGSTRSVKLSSGDVVVFGGPSRLAFHGIDRIMSGTSQLVPGGGRINLTLRRVAQK
jgi:alkylated DNA repair protein (DNA oxidative demethylase)